MFLYQDAVLLVNMPLAFDIIVAMFVHVQFYYPNWVINQFNHDHIGLSLRHSVAATYSLVPKTLWFSLSLRPQNEPLDCWGSRGYRTTAPRITFQPTRQTIQPVRIREALDHCWRTSLSHTQENPRGHRQTTLIEREYFGEPRLTRWVCINHAQNNVVWHNYHEDSECPICYVSFRAVIASEEVTLATDNPGFASEDLGVTRLADSCGHAFCRREYVINAYPVYTDWSLSK